MNDDRWIIRRCGNPISLAMKIGPWLDESGEWTDHLALAKVFSFKEAAKVADGIAVRVDIVKL